MNKYGRIKLLVLDSNTCKHFFVCKQMNNIELNY